MRRWHMSFRFTRIGLDQISAAGVQLRKSEREIVKHKGRELHLQTWTLRSHWRFAVHAESTHGNAASTANDWLRGIMRVKSFDKAVCMHLYYMSGMSTTSILQSWEIFHRPHVQGLLCFNPHSSKVRLPIIDRFCILSMLRDIELSFDVQRSRSVIQPKMEKGLSSWP